MPPPVAELDCFRCAHITKRTPRIRSLTEEPAGQAGSIHTAAPGWVGGGGEEEMAGPVARAHVQGYSLLKWRGSEGHTGCPQGCRMFFLETH